MQHPPRRFSDTELSHKDSDAETARAVLATIILLCGLLLIPPDRTRKYGEQRSFDYIGTLLLALAVGLFNFAWNQGPLVGWDKPYVYVLLIVSVGFGAVFYFYERPLGAKALVPTEVLTRQSLLVYLSLWLGWMSFGIFLYYTPLL